MIDTAKLPNQNETRWTPGAWLVLTLGLVLVAWPLAATLLSFSFPSDGWVGHYNPANTLYELDYNLSGRSSPLEPGDRVLAVGDNQLAANRLIAPRGFQVGQTVRYTVERGGETRAVDVTLVRLSPLALLRYNWLAIQAGSTFTFVNLIAALIPALVFIRRPGNAGARLLFIIFAYIFAEIWINFPAWLSLYGPGLPFPLSYATWFYDSLWPVTVGASLILLALVFPVRKAPVRRFPRLLPGILYGLPLIVSAVTSWMTLSTLDLSWNVPFMVILAITYLGAVVAIITSLVHSLMTVRERIARAQLAWMGLGLGVGFGGLLVLYVLTGVYGSLVPDPESDVAYVAMQSVASWILLLLPLSLAVAITRYRLFDIDVIIRRTLVYSTLTVLLALFYFGSVVVLQQLLRGLTGQGSDLAIIVSTLAIAALSIPLRNRIQRAIDHRFYRRKYDAAQVLSHFAATVRDEVDLGRLTDELQAVVQETMQPESVSVSLADGGQGTKHEGRRMEA